MSCDLPKLIVGTVGEDVEETVEIGAVVVSSSIALAMSGVLYNPANDDEVVKATDLYVLSNTFRRERMDEVSFKASSCSGDDDDGKEES